VAAAGCLYMVTSMSAGRGESAATTLRRTVEAPLVERSSTDSGQFERFVLSPIEGVGLSTVRSGRPIAVAAIVIDQRLELELEYGHDGFQDICEYIALRVGEQLGEHVAWQFDERLVIFADALDQRAGDGLSRLGKILGSHLVVAGVRQRIEYSVVWCELAADQRLSDAYELTSRMALARSGQRRAAFKVSLPAAAERADRLPPPAAKWRPSKRMRIAGQIASTWLAGLLLPFLLYFASARLWTDVTNLAYLLVVVALLGTSASIWIEWLLARRPLNIPQPIFGPPPPATALIAAYLPNETETVLETIRAVLASDYRGPLQVLLVYNSPVRVPVEDELYRLAQEDPRLQLVRVVRSKSKADNINTGLNYVTGRYIGVFDADHCPDPDAFTRADRWLSNGTDVVQGRCVVRNGEDSLVAKTVAVEFESIYGLAHPGRARLHQWGIFGGSNGYWRTEVLREIRMDASMLTEDIDSATRAVIAGYRIDSDPELVSRELATTRLVQLWNQRLRWAQGWHQVSKRRLPQFLRSPHLNVRQKVGATHLFLWREIYPWISIQMIPIIAFWFFDRREIDWFVPVFVATTALTMLTGPVQTILSYQVANSETKKHPKWFFMFAIVEALGYQELRNTIGRVAQLKDLAGENEWKVTARLR
jgi:cellulose synthase/poly-beta-1,6-N-acetylglucosamine synthase-like glycosyltransferase